MNCANCKQSIDSNVSVCLNCNKDISPAAQLGVKINARDVKNGSITGVKINELKGDLSIILTEGLAKLPTDYSPRIQNFMQYYLGTPHQPAPFGGRKAELAALDEWFSNAAAPPYGLLAAEAGRGKSALLSRWAESLIAREMAHVVFIPVSIRFNTALATVTFTALAARLAEVYGEQIEWSNLSAEQWRGVCQSYLERTPPDGKPVVIILDGLDEAADWQLGASFFSSLPPAGVRAIVSARYLAGDADESGWRRRLGWESTTLAYSLPLPPLTPDGLRDVLHKMGNPLDQLVTNVDMISQLYRLSEGDPLLVRLYVEILLPYGERVAMITPEQLEAIPPGLEGYFKRWWDEQRQLWGKERPLKEQNVRTLLNLLACALGPLSQDTLLELAPSEADLDEWTLEDALEPLARFVVGDGNQQGYVFSHPKLSDYFWKRLGKHKQSEWENRFLDYGCQTLDALNDGNLHPHKAPSYAIQYYGAHLERASAPPEAFYALVSKGSMRAWEALEGTYAGFLNDVERAWKRAESQRDIVMQIKCALCFASVISLSTNIPPDLLKELAKCKEWTPSQALAYASQIKNDERRAEALAKLIPYLRPSEQPTICDKVLQICSQTQDNKIKAFILVELCIVMEQKEQLLEQALKCIQSLSDNENRQKAKLIEKLAPHLSPKQLYRARDIAQKIGDANWKSIALGRIAARLPEPERDETLQEAVTLISKGPPSFAWPKLAPYLSDSLLRQLLTQDLTAIEGAHKLAWYRAIADTVFHLAKLGYLDEAICRARNIWYKDAAVSALAQILPYVTEETKRQNLLEEVKSAVENLSFRYDAAWTSIKLMPYLKKSEQEQRLTEIRGWMRPTSMDDGGYDGQWLGMLIKLARSNGVCEEIKDKYLQEALDIIEGSYESVQGDEMMAKLAPNLSAPLLRRAVKIAKSIRDETVQAQAFLRFLSSESLPKKGSPVLANKTREIALRIGSNYYRASLLIELLPHLPDTEWPSMRAKILQAIQKVAHDAQDSYYQAEVLARLAYYLVKQGHHQDALDIIRSESQDSSQPLRAIAHYLPSSLLEQALEFALTIPSLQERFHAAIVCGAHLPHDTGVFVIRTLFDSAFTTLENNQWANLVSNMSSVLVKHEYSDLAIDAARKIDENLPKQKAEVLAKIVRCLPEQEGKALVPEALDAAKAIGYERDRLLAKARLAPYLSEKEIRIILDRALTIKHDNLTKQEVSIALVPYLDEQTRNEVIQQLLPLPSILPDFLVRNLSNLAPYLTGSLLEEARRIARTNLSKPHQQAKTLTALATRPTEAESEKVEALKEVIKIICAPNGVGLELMNGIANTLSSLPRETLYPIWNDTIRTLGSSHNRQNLLVGITALIPVIAVLGRDNVMEDTVETIQEVCEWWP